MPNYSYPGRAEAQQGQDDVVSAHESSGNYTSRHSHEASITPQKLRYYTFKRAFGGYSVPDVDNIVEQAALAMEELIVQRQEVERLNQERLDVEKTMAHARSLERQLAGRTDELSAARSENEELRNIAFSLKQELAAKAEELSFAKEQNERLSAAASSLEEELASKNRDLAEAASAIDELVTKAAAEQQYSISQEMQRALLLVENTLSAAREILAEEAEKIVSEANLKAEEVLVSAREEAEALAREAALARQDTERRIREYRSLLTAHLADTPEPCRD